MTYLKIRPQWLALIFGVGIVLASAGCTADDSRPVTPTAAQPCPTWVEFPADNHSNADPLYLGCVNHINLVNMLQSPADLDEGRPLGFESSERETTVLKDYDQNKNTTFKEVNAPATPPPAAGSAGGGGP